MRATRRREWTGIPLVLALLLTGPASAAPGGPGVGGVTTSPLAAGATAVGSAAAQPGYTAPANGTAAAPANGTAAAPANDTAAAPANDTTTAAPVVAAAIAEAAHADPTTPVSLVVGVTPATTDVDAPIDRLVADTRIAVSGAEPVAAARAVTVDVPAGDIAEAAAALLSDPAVAYVEPDHVAGTDGVTVNDPERDDQWGLDRTGVPAAWDVTRGASEVVVAVVDTGVTVTSELSGRVLAGYNFVGNNTNTTDDNGHGTTVATVIAGAPDNGVAGAGICWYCRILPVKALAANGVGSYSSIARSITWAADHGADIINLSLGGSDASRLLTDAVAYANRKGALVVAAAGNDGSSARHYPAATDGALSVGASTSSDARFPWSNYGSSWVDVAAPGCNVAQQRNGKPAWFCGTSSATPFVSGVAALARSLRPEPSAARIRSLLQATARPLRGGWVAGGRVDAAKALTLAGWSTGVGATPYVRTDQTLTPAFGDGLSVTSVVASVDGVTVATAAAAPWSLAVPTGTLTGPVTVVVTAYDGAVEVARTARALVVDRTVPSVSFRSPVAAARVGRRMTVAANAVDAVHVAKVELLVRGAVVATDTAAPWSLAWPSSGNGRTTVTLRVTDGAGNTAAVSRTVTLDNVGPSTRIASGPRDGRRGVRGTVRVRVKAADPAGVAKVQLLVDGRVVGTATGPSGTFAVRTAKYGRTMRVKARGYDRLGNVTTSTVRTWRR